MDPGSIVTKYWEQDDLAGMLRKEMEKGLSGMGCNGNDPVRIH